jgi:3-methyladenine DNA glycosylase Mpg
MWVLVSSTGKVTSRRIRNLSSNTATQKTNWCLGLMIKRNHHGVDAIGSNHIVFIKKKKRKKKVSTNKIFYFSKRFLLIYKYLRDGTVIHP